MRVVASERKAALQGSDRAGFALIVILVIVMLLSLAAYGFLLSMQTENMAARTQGDQLLAQQHALSGIEWMSASLERPAAQRNGPTGKGSRENPFVVSLETEESRKPETPSAMCLIVQPHVAQRPAEVADISLGMINESSKLHLVTLLELEKLQPGSGRNALMRLPGMTGADADALLDWVDADSQPRAEGAEADYYAGLPTPYSPRNGLPLDLDELLLVRGLDSFRLFGRAEPGMETTPDRGLARPLTGEPMLPWSHYLTVWSAEQNVAQDGAPRIFVNDPQLARLHQRLSQVLPVDLANYLILYRQFGPGPATPQSREAGQITPDFSRPAVRNLESLLDVIGVTLVMPQNGMTVSVASPFKSDPASMQSQLPMLLDKLTVSRETRLTGRLNINLAPKEALLALPGLDEGLAERILGARSMDQTGTAARRHAAWLLTEGLVDLPIMRKLLPWITVTGDVFRAEFWGIHEPRSPMFRCEAVIDASHQPARQMYFRDLPPLPRELSERLLAGEN